MHMMYITNTNNIRMNNNNNIQINNNKNIKINNSSDHIMKMMVE
jgi:hypothetical protein